MAALLVVQPGHAVGLRKRSLASLPYFWIHRSSLAYLIDLTCSNKTLYPDDFIPKGQMAMPELNSLPQKLIDLYLHACWLDQQALKPGNVGIHSETEELTVEGFLRSAKVSAEPLVKAEISLGERIWNAVQATQQEVRTNTNLGIILLLAPLIQASLEQKDGSFLRDSLQQVLENSTVEDAARVYHAIRLAEPGGMGEKSDHDLSEEPTVSLLNTMKIAASWDRVADQYSNNFRDIFEFGVPSYKSYLDQWNDERWATTGLFLGFLARFPDSLIERKHGVLKAREISDMISGLEREFCRSDIPGRYEAQLLKIDGHLKRDRINPGTTADLTVASIFAADLSTTVKRG